MPGIFFISGPCGSGKSTFADAFAKHLVQQTYQAVYVIHGDDFHQGFVQPEYKENLFVSGRASDPVQWEEILRFNWDCIISTAGRVLRQGFDVVIDYVIEDELPRVIELTEIYHAFLCYIVLTADTEEIRRRLRNRGDTDLVERALFLKKELEAMPENQGHLYNNTGKATEDMIREINPDHYLIRKSPESRP